MAALGTFAVATVVPASADYQSLSYSYCSGYGATNKYSTYVASETNGTAGCWKWLTARRLESSTWITYYLDFGYASVYADDYPASQPGWGTHGLGPDEWAGDWKDTVDNG